MIMFRNRSWPWGPTEALLTTGCTVTAIEIDSGAVEHLNSVFSTELESQQLTIHQGDALQVNWPSDITKVIANIPYQISSPLIELLTRYLRSKWQHLVKVILLVQEEFAERLVMEYESDVGSLGMTACSIGNVIY